MPKTRPKTAKCPWCSRVVALTDKDACRPHLTAGKQQCVGSGIPRRNWPPGQKE